MNTCATCNASHKNTVDRVLRCMGCVAKPDGNSNWRPLMPNVEFSGGAPLHGAASAGTQGYASRHKEKT